MNQNNTSDNLKIKVKLFEENNSLCHLQKNCFIRRLHPNVQSWPLRGWDKKNSDHPIAEINWTADSAAAVSNRITKNLIEILEDIEGRNLDDLLSVYTHCNDILISQTLSKYRLTISGEQNFGELRESERGSYSFPKIDIIIIASGFGVERSLEKNVLLKNQLKTSSYWRNESFSQTNLYKKDLRYLISGNGDGGLVDLFRLLIDGYAQDDTLEQLIPTDLNKFKKFASHPYFQYPINQGRKIKKLEKGINEIEKNLEKMKAERNGYLNAKLKFPERKKKEHLERIDKDKLALDKYKKEIKVLNQEIEEFDTKVLEFKKSYRIFIDKLIDFKKNETNENERLFEWLESYFSKKENFKILEFIRGLIVAKLKTQNEILFFIKSKNPHKNKIEAVIENPNITFYNRILFYFVWCFSNFEIIKSNPEKNSDDELLNLINRYNISYENIILRHGSLALAPISTLISDSGLSINLNDVYKSKEKFKSEIIIDYRYDKKNFTTKL